jgi:hypothetical protein
MKTKLLYAALAIMIAIIAAPMLMSPPPDTGTGKPVTGLPWQIEVLPDGSSRISGLTMGKSTMSDAHARFGEGELALVAAPGETETLELYFSDVTLGVVTGKLIATAEIPADTLAAMRKRATKTEYMESSTKKSQLADQDLPAAFAAPIRAIAFVPAINLDETMIIQRFGQPAERIRTSEQAEHFLYPDRGLDVTLDSKNKELLQYVAPRNFVGLHEPLKALEAKP